jgi:hypothetical protein
MNFYDYVSLVQKVEQEDEVALGKSKNDLTVECRPNLEDRNIIQSQNRVVCLAQPYAACPYCPHSSFELIFNTAKEQRYELVSCPRWENAAGRFMGQSPDGYVSVEVATCERAPFEFCPSCPSRKHISSIGADKSTPGWYGRWHRLRKEMLEDKDG